MLWGQRDLGLHARCCGKGHKHEAGGFVDVVVLGCHCCCGWLVEALQQSLGVLQASKQEEMIVSTTR
jgi:hypothetical protein